jgi:putative hydrolase of the HAD superfamily
LNVKVVIFDLDDTLYNEIEFVKSGFLAVADYFAQKYDLDAKELFDIMEQNLQLFGRGEVFDKSLQHFGIYSVTNVKKSLSIYRTHTPKISLPVESKELLEYCRSLGYQLYLLTDGNKIVQSNKIKALKIEGYFNKTYITHRYGIKYAKPSTYCFEKISQKEGVSYKDMLYIGDNINKDFLNIKKLGMRTIRIKNGMFKDQVKPQEFHAEIDVQKLSEIKKVLCG